MRTQGGEQSEPVNQTRILPKLNHPIKLVVAEDYAIVREGLCILLETRPELRVIGKASKGKELVDLCEGLSPDVVIMQGRLPDINNEEVVRLITQQCDRTKILGIIALLDPLIIAGMIRAGVSGLLLKNGEFKELLEAIDVVYLGGFHLSPSIAGTVLEDKPGSDGARYKPDWSVLTHRETEILRMMASAKNTKEIASELDLSTNTVYVHRRNIMEKLNIKNSVELTKMAIREGITDIY